MTTQNNKNFKTSTSEKAKWDNLDCHSEHNFMSSFVTAQDDLCEESHKIKKLDSFRQTLRITRGKCIPLSEGEGIKHHFLTSLPTNLLTFKPAFTLAEVLITLAIIGIVAAMTLPALMTAYNKHITETRLKKFYSLFNQAIKLSIVENDEPEGWDDYWKPSKTTSNGDGTYEDKVESIEAAFDKYLAPYMKVMLKKQVKDEKKNVTISLYYLADGSAFTYRGTDNRDITFFPKNPEKCLKQEKQYGRCSFRFIFYPIVSNKYWKYHYKKGLEPHMYEWDGTKESLYKNSTYSCAEESSGIYCTALIKENGWKIPSDYPLKIQY